MSLGQVAPTGDFFLGILRCDFCHVHYVLPFCMPIAIAMANLQLYHRLNFNNNIMDDMLY